MYELIEWYNSEEKSQNLTPVELAAPKATIAELSSILGINPSAVQKQLKSLSGKGYITRTPTSNEWRVIAISTTK